MREKLTVFTAIAIFLIASGYLLWRESAFAHLKSGISLYRKGDTTAIPIFESGIAKNRQSYLLRNYLAKTLHTASLRGGHKTPRGRVMILEARQHLSASLDLRRDTFDHMALAENYRLEGDDISGYAEYNISFFLSLNPEELKRWHTPKEPPGRIAAQYFDKGEIATAMIIAYNRLTGYEVKRLATASQKPGAIVVGSFFKGQSPGKWFSETDTAGKEKAVSLLRSEYDRLTEEEKRSVLIDFNNTGMLFLEEMVAGDGV